MAVRGLEYVISLTDKMSSPLKHVSKSVDNFSAKTDAFISKTKAAMGNIAVGAAGLAAVGLSMKNALMPAIEMDRALGETASLGVADSAIEKLRKTALDFSIEYGKSAVDVVRSSYGIKQAFGNLNDTELTGLTKTTNILAAATKTNVDAAKDYLSRMYAIYSKQADKIGKVQWAEKLSSQTTMAIKLFKTDASKLETTFKTIAGVADKAGISFEEQLAIVGQLQGKVGEAKAGKQYEAFINGLSNAQQKLGLNFHDNNGKLLSADKILLKLKKRFGDVSKHKDAIKKAFGGDSAYRFIENMIDETGEIKTNIDKLSNVKGLAEVSATAHKMTDPWERLEALIFGVSSSLGSALQPKLYPILNKVIDIGDGFRKWLDTYRNIARWISYLISGFMGFAAVGPVIMTLKGVFTLWWASMKGALGVLLAIGKAMKLNIVFNKLYAASLVVMKTIMAVVSTIARLMWSAITGPVGLIIAIIALIGYVIYKNWDSIKTYTLAIWEGIKNIWQSAVNFFINLWEGVKGLWSAYWSFIGSILETVWTGIKTGWQAVIDFFSNVSPLQAFNKLGDGLTTIFANAYQGLKNKLIDMLNWVIEKLNKLPGVNIDLIPTVSGGSTTSTQIENVANKVRNGQQVSSFIAPLPESIKPDITPQPGLLKNKVSSSTTNHSVNFNGSITVQANNPTEFMQQLQDAHSLSA